MKIKVRISPRLDEGDLHIHPMNWSSLVFCVNFYKLFINGNLYIDTDATIVDDPDEDMNNIVEEIEKLIKSKLGMKFVAHEAELTDENDNLLWVYET